jgi:hypothetical protein
MSRLSLLAVGLLSVFQFCRIVGAQDLCPANTITNKLICFIPQAFGPSQTLDVGNLKNNSQFTLKTLNESLRSLNSAVGRSSSLLPRASPSSGLVFSWDPAAKVFFSTTDSLGPILGERAETIGKYRVFLGFSYQYFDFDRVDGIKLKQLPVTITQPDDDVDAAPRVCSINGDNQTECGFIRDVVKTNTRLDLKIHQFTTFITFGITNRLDVSVAIPIENVRMASSSTATIVDNAQSDVYSFPMIPGTCGDVQGGVITPGLVNSFSSVQNVSGIGDITLRVKGTAWKGERAGLALGVDIRTPTGDALNFLGAGAAGVKPFVVWSYRSRISPHLSVGYETNGSSLIAGDIPTSKKVKLPSQLIYSAGADFWLTKWLTTDFDLVGQQVFEADRTSLTKIAEPGACLDPAGTCTDPPGFAAPKIDPSIIPTTGSYNSTSASIGVKVRPFGSKNSFVMTGNALIGINNGGLRSKVVPLIGFSYTF